MLPSLDVNDRVPKGGNQVGFIISVFTCSFSLTMHLTARDPYAIEDDDLVMVDKEDVEGHSPKEELSRLKRKSKRQVREPIISI